MSEIEIKPQNDKPLASQEPFDWRIADRLRARANRVIELHLHRANGMRAGIYLSSAQLPYLWKGVKEDGPCTLEEQQASLKWLTQFDAGEFDGGDLMGDEKRRV